MSEHDESHILDQIDAYLAGGLAPGERAAFEAHVASCPACATAVARANEADRELRGLFSDARPSPGFEDRLVRSVRMAGAPRRRLIHPMVLRSSAAVAAAVLLAGTGLAVSSALQQGGNPLLTAWADAGRVRADSNLRQIGRSIGMYSKDGHADDKPPVVWSESNGDGLANNTSLYYRVAPAGAAPSNANWGFRMPQPPAVKLEAGGKPAPTDAFDAVTVPLGEASKGGRAYGGLRGSGGAGGGFGAQAAPGATSLGVEGKPAADSYGLAFKPADQLGRGTTGVNGQFARTGGESQLGRERRDLSRQLGDKLADGETNAAKPTQAAEKAPDVGALRLGFGDLDVKVENDKRSGNGPSGPTDAGNTTATPTTNPVALRKVIRNGTMEFEVDRFDDAVMRVTKLVNEQDGFVATTDSDKLPNGHMRGTLTLRVPPERLDTLILTLRGIGDLKSQKIAAEDVTKHYTDLDSQLRAARAMEERLLGLIKSGNGQIKDLLAAEKELGVWREKIEAIEGEKRYLDNQVSLSTLVVSLYEKDIRTPASASETEQVQMSLETEAVDDAYNKALEAIRSAKGRITQSELKQYDAGQVGATIVAAVPPDASEAVIARLRQLAGRIAHFSRDRQQTTKDGSAAPAAAVTQVQREDTTISLQIYNLANIAPRRTTTLQVATNQVDRNYAQVVEQVRAAGGRIVTSSLNKPDPNTHVADLDLQVPTDKADALLDVLRGYGEVMQQELGENPDTANVTEAKRGIHLRLVSLAAVPARETQTLQLAAVNVPTAFNEILNAAKSADARVFQSDLSEQNPQEITAAITIEVPRQAEAAVDAAIGKASQVLTRTINRSTDLEKTVDTKVRLTLAILSADRMPPRQTTTEQIQVSDVGRASDDLIAAATSAGGRQIGTGGSEQNDAHHDTSHVIVEVPMNSLGAILDQLDRDGTRRGKQVSFDSSVPDGRFARARVDVTFSNSPSSLGGEETTWDALRNGLAVSGRGLRWSLQLLVIGFCFVAPWVFVLWILWRFIRRSRSRPAPATAPAT